MEADSRLQQRELPGRGLANQERKMLGRWLLLFFGAAVALILVTLPHLELEAAPSSLPVCSPNWQDNGGDYTHVGDRPLSAQTYTPIANASIPPGLWEVQWDYYLTKTSVLNYGSGGDIRIWVESSYYPNPVDPSSLNNSYPSAQVWENVTQGIAIVHGPATFYVSGGAHQDRSDTAGLQPIWFRARWRCPTGIRPTPTRIAFSGDDATNGVLNASSTVQLALPKGPHGSPWAWNRVVGSFVWPGAAADSASVSLIAGDNDASYLQGAQIHRWFKGAEAPSAGLFPGFFLFRADIATVQTFALQNNSANNITGYKLWFINEAP